MQCDFQCYCASALVTLSCCRMTTQLLCYHIPSLVSTKYRILRITHTYIYIHTHTNADTHAHTYIYIHTHKCRHTRTHTHTHTHAHTHTHIHTRKHTNYNFQKSQTKIYVLKKRQSVALCSIWHSKTQLKVDTSLKSLLMLYYPV